MGRAGFEPATLGLKVDGGRFADPREGGQTRTVEQKRLGLNRPVSGLLVDPGLTPASRATGPEMLWGAEVAPHKLLFQAASASGAGPVLNPRVQSSSVSPSSSNCHW